METITVRYLDEQSLNSQAYCSVMNAGCRPGHGLITKYDSVMTCPLVPTNT